MKTKTKEQAAVLDGLLKEKNLSQVYFSSTKIPFSKTNIVVAVLSAAVVGSFNLNAESTSGLANQLNSFATLAFNLSIGLLGFLLAGFSFFSTVGDREMFCLMAEKMHQKSGLSWLKYNFLIFMRVFFEFLVLTFVSLALMLLTTKQIGIREAFSTILDPKLKHILAALVFSLFVGSIVYLLMQLASFIFNIYHVVMSSIRWALEREFDKANSQSLGIVSLPPESESNEE